MFIQTEDTPNPATMKFLPNRSVLGDRGGLEFETAESASQSPLAISLLGVQGVDRVFLGSDFISVTRDDKTSWQILRPLVLQVIMTHFLENRPVLLSQTDESDAEEETEIAQKICKVLDERIRPAVAQDGGDITFERYEDGVAYLRLRGACAGCPSATATLKMGVERLLNAMVPEVREVRQVR